MYPELVVGNRYLSLCKDCIICLRRGSRPKYSISTDFDLGNPTRCGLADLDWVEELCIVRVHVLTSALNLRLPKRRGHYYGVLGHCIAFADDAANTCGLRMPDVAFAGEQVLITVEGPPGTTTSEHLESAIRRLGMLDVDLR